MEAAGSRSRTLDLVRAAGMLCVIGGAGWFAVGLVSEVIIHPTGAGYAVSQAVWIVVQSLLLVGVIGLALSGAAAGWFGTIALCVALLGRLDFVAAEFHSLAIGEESFLLPVGALLTALGMTLVGVAVIRAGRWSGWRRFTPFVTGVYPFVAMFPFIAVSDEPSMLAISFWGLLWVPLGYAILTSGDGTERRSDPENS